MKIVMIRHSKTAGNQMGRYIGTTDEPLCQEGIDLLREFTYPEVEAVCTSPMKRCLETAELIYPGVPLWVEEDLKECDFGEFENRNYQELSGNPHYQAWVDSGGTLAFPGGESREVFMRRCVDGFCRAVEEGMGRGIQALGLVVHGGTIMSVLSALAVPAKPFYEWQVKNGKGFLLNLGKEFPEKREIFVLKKI